MVAPSAYSLPMTEFAQMLQESNGNAWWFLPSAIALGALHGLEPGHSKTMMAAFIIAVRGTVGQAVLLGLSATLSHTAVVWAVAMGGLYFGDQWDLAQSGSWLQLISAVLIAATALWMAQRTWRQAHPHHHHHGHDHDHYHDHDHGHHHDHHHDDGVPMDDHARAHAQEIQERFHDGKASTGQIVVFGLTGGLIPCPASITVLLLCLQLKQVALGATLVLGFSVGLALTMVASGVLAAWSVRQVQARWSGWGHWAGRAPYLSSALMLVLAASMAWDAWRGWGVPLH